MTLHYKSKITKRLFVVLWAGKVELAVFVLTSRQRKIPFWIILSKLWVQWNCSLFIMAGMIWVESTLLKRILKHELNKDNTNKHAKLDGRKPRRPQFYTKSSVQVRKAGSRSSDLPQGRACQLAFQYQVVRPENIHTSNITWTEHAFRNIYFYINTYMCAAIISEKPRLWIWRRNRPQPCLLWDPTLRLHPGKSNHSLQEQEITYQ